MSDLNEIRGRKLVIGVNSREDANMEAARILRDAIEAGDPYVVVRCISRGASEQSENEGVPQTLGDVMLTVSDIANGPYEMFMIMAMLLHWVETSTKLPRPLVVRSMMTAAKVLDKVKGGSHGDGSADGTESGDVGGEA